MIPAIVACSTCRIGGRIRRPAPRLRWPASPTLDGYYARKLGQTSRLGAFPRSGGRQADRRRAAGADRQQGSALVRGDRRDRHHRPRNRRVGAARMDGGDRRARRIAVSVLASYKTIMQIVGLSCLLFRRDLLGLPTYKLGLVLTLLAAVLTLWSMILYLRLAWPELRGSSRL
jgi:hypothetical protein